MGDPFGNLAGGGASTAYDVYQTGQRAKPFFQGAIDSAQGAMLGRDVAKYAFAAKAAAPVAEAAVSAGAGEALGTAAGAAAGALEGAEVGTAVMPGIGTAVGLVAGAIAPHIIPHIPVVGKAVSKIPIVGGILSPQHKNVKPWSDYVAPSVATQSGADYSANQRARYTAGRGYR